MKSTITHFAVTTLAIFSLQFASAQEFGQGTNVINVGIGFGGYYYGYDTSSQSPLFNISYERGIWELPGPGIISLGGYFGYKSFVNNSQSIDYDWTYSILGVRGAYHYTGFEIEHLDVYGGVMATFNIYNGTGGDDFKSRPGATPFVGGRWYFSDQFAAFAEGSYGVAFLTLGVSFRF